MPPICQIGSNCSLISSSGSHAERILLTQFSLDEQSEVESLWCVALSYEAPCEVYPERIEGSDFVETLDLRPGLGVTFSDHFREPLCPLPGCISESVAGWEQWL